jgi:hypothetical protein
MKAVNDAEYHIIKILSQKSKIKIILISVVWVWASFMRNVLKKEKLYVTIFLVEVAEQLWQRINRSDRCCIKTRIGLFCFMLEHLHVLHLVFRDFFHEKGFWRSLLPHSPYLALADFSFSKNRKEALLSST